MGFYLAMTAEEMNGCPRLPSEIAWLSCHFSERNKGLSNCPASLPEGAMLVLDDRIPPEHQDPAMILQQLQNALTSTGALGIIADFQRPKNEATLKIVQALEVLKCPVIVTPTYAASTCFGILLPPLPLHISLKDHLAPWKGRRIWLEIANEAELATITEEGCSFCSAPPPRSCSPLYNKELNCHYSLSIGENQAQILLHRTKDDLVRLMEQATYFHIDGMIGLYQELQELFYLSG